MKVSIIIPIYNAEKYICRCLDSLLAQSYQDFELICVDDGSTDDTPAILQNYARRDDRITVLHQSNQYAGAARNNGMKKANGKYLLFLDADDFFGETMLEEIVKKAEEDYAEVLVFDAFYYDDKLQSVIKGRGRFLKAELFGAGIKKAESIADIIYEFVTPASWNKLFLREFIEKDELQFQVIQRSNDLYFVYAALSCASRISVLDKKLLYYRYNNENSLQGRGDDTSAVFAEALYELKDFLEKRNWFEIFRKSYEKMAVSVVFYNLNNMKSTDFYSFLYQLLQQDILFKIGYEKKMLDAVLERILLNREKCIVYGAGDVARTLVWTLLMKFGYQKENIKVVVTDTQNTVEEVWGIKVHTFAEISTEEQTNLVMIALSDKKIQEEIEQIVQKKNFSKVIKIGFSELADIII